MDSLGRQSSWMNAWWRETVSSYDSEDDALDYAPISGGFSKLDTRHLKTLLSNMTTTHQLRSEWNNDEKNQHLIKD